MAYTENQKLIIEWYLKLLRERGLVKSKDYRELYDQLYYPTKINIRDRQSPNKYDDMADYFYYLGPEDQAPIGDTNMLGREYVKRADANYRHLREMLNYCWNICNVMPADRFDIDYRFKYDPNELARYLSASFDRSTLDEAHAKARANYKGRGRPQGARNKDKVFGKHDPYAAPNPNDPFALDISIDEAEMIIKDEIDKLQPKQLPAPNANANIDLSAYVTHIQLNAREYVTSPQLVNVANKIGDALRTYVDEQVKLSKPTIVELKKTDAPNVQLGVQHRHFPELLAMCVASTIDGSHLNVWLHGPAATGKTTASRMVAKALTAHFGREFPFYMVGALETGFQVLGYMDANGKYSSTLFRQCFEHGGVICLDEQDSYTPSAALALNGALANGHCAFPDKIVERHPDCIVIAGANTTGLGGTMEYVGRLKQDAAFLDRFVMLDWPIDEALEDHLCPNKPWLTIVRHCRSQVIQKQIKGALVTMRASIYGDSLLRAGVSVERALKATIQKGMSEAQWNMIKPDIYMLDACQGKQIAAE